MLLNFLFEGFAFSYHFKKNLLFVINNVSTFGQIIQLLDCPNAVSVNIELMSFYLFLFFFLMIKAYTLFKAKNIEQCAAINQVHIQEINKSEKKPNGDIHILLFSLYSSKLVANFDIYYEINHYKIE